MASIKATLYTSKTLNDNKHPIMIQVHKDGKRSTFSTGFFALKNQWNLEYLAEGLTFWQNVALFNMEQQVVHY